MLAEIEMVNPALVVVLLTVFVWVVTLIIFYWLIRLAVRHGVCDAMGTANREHRRWEVFWRQQ